MKKLLLFILLTSSIQVFADDYTKAMQLYDNSNYKAAIAPLKILADKGHAKAQFNLATLYDGGYGVNFNQEEAVKWYTKAALQGHINAQHLLSLSYCLGSGVMQNFKSCAKWAKKAREGGFNNDELWNEFELWEYQ